MSANPLRRYLPLAAAIFGAILVVPAAAAVVSNDEGVRQTMRAVLSKAATHEIKVAAPEAMKLVWRGADVDGDGRGDFINPTGHQARNHDDWGSGHFGDSRDGGARRHEGVDYSGVAGQSVAAPISGYVTKIGLAYGGADPLQFVEISNPALNYTVRVFYIRPSVEVGEAVAMGTKIGKLVSLQDHYPGITDHVHLEVYDDGSRIDAARVIVAQRVRVSKDG